MDTSALYGSLCMDNSAIYGPYTGHAHGHFRPLRVSMHGQFRVRVALYKPRTLTTPASTGIYTRTIPCQWSLYRPCANESLELWENENESLELWKVHHFP